MKQRSGLPGGGIERLNGVVLDAVAPAAGIRQIIEAVGAAANDGQDVINGAGENQSGQPQYSHKRLARARTRA